MKTRPWRYLVEFHHHNNTDCPQPAPKPGRGMIKMWGTGDLPLCPECARLDRSLNPQLEQLAQVVNEETEGPRTEAPTSAEVDDKRDPD
jgi:hypothetical protein